jgi:UDP-glucose 4-epimerase
MVLPNFVSSALAGRDIRVYGDGRQTRCFCDVRDVAGALPRLLGSAGSHGRVFNLGSDRPISINELAELVITTLGSRARLVHVPYDQAYSAGFEDLRRREPDLSRIRAEIDFAPTVTLGQTIRDLAAWMSDRPMAAGFSAAAPGGRA